MSYTQNETRREYVKQLKDLNLDDPEFDIKFNQINQSFNTSQSESMQRDNNDMQKQTNTQINYDEKKNIDIDKKLKQKSTNHNPFNMLEVLDGSDFFDVNPFHSLSRIHNNLYRMMNYRTNHRSSHRSNHGKNHVTNYRMFDSSRDLDPNNDLFFEKGEFDEKKLDNLDINTYNETDMKSYTNNDLNDLNDLNTQNINEPQKYYKYVSSMTTYDNNGVRKAKSISRTEKYDGKNKSVKQVSKFQDGDTYVEEYLNPDGTTRRIEKKIKNNMLE